MNRLEIEKPSLDVVKEWEKEFLRQLKSSEVWIGEPEEYSVRLYVLDGTDQIKFETAERLEDSLSDLTLYGFFADAGEDQIADQNRVFDQMQKSISRKFNTGDLPYSKEAYFDSLAELVPDIGSTGRFLEPVELKGVSQNIDAVAEIDRVLSESEDYTVEYVKLNAGESSDNVVGAYRNLQSNCSIEIGFLYTGDKTAESEVYKAEKVPGEIHVDGNSTDVELYLEDVDIEAPDLEKLVTGY